MPACTFTQSDLRVTLSADRSVDSFLQNGGGAALRLDSPDMQSDLRDQFSAYVQRSISYEASQITNITIHIHI